MDLGIAGKNAIIAASSAGLGFACAESLAKEGVNVVINGRDKDRLDTAAEKLRLIAKGTVTGVVGDIALDETRLALLQACPRPDILITNNGGPPPGRFQDWGRDNWLSAVDSNMLAPLLLIRDVLDGMVERKFGRIINITSVVGSSGNAGQANYAAAKAGVAGLTRSLARELGSRNITVNCVAPGFIDTDMTRALSEAQIAALTAQIPLGRLGQADDVAHLVAFLASEHAGYITGSELHVNGGMFMN